MSPFCKDFRTGKSMEQESGEDTILKGELLLAKKFTNNLPWIVAESPSSLIISPMRLSCPTRTSSYMAAPPIPSATTTGPDTCYGRHNDNHIRSTNSHFHSKVGDLIVMNPIQNETSKDIGYHRF